MLGFSAGVMLAIVFLIYINEFWTSGQRQASPLHEISYRACFKPPEGKPFLVPGRTVDILE